MVLVNESAYQLKRTKRFEEANNISRKFFDSDWKEGALKIKVWELMNLGYM